MVSLVMPVWRPNPVWFRAAVASALAEHECEIELIVVDDGNPEPVAELLADCDDERLELVVVAHGGVSAARNAGIARARGDFIRFVDADDVVEPGSTARLLRLGGGGRLLAYGDTLVCDPELRPQRLVEEDAEGDVLLDSVVGGFDVYITAILFPREVVAAAGGFDPTIGMNEDFDFVLRALEHAPVRGGSFVASRYRRHGDSATAHGAEMNDFAAFERLLQRRPELRGTPYERRARAHLELVAASAALNGGRYRAGIRRLARSLRTDPRTSAPEVATFLRGFLAGLARRLGC